MPKSSGRPSLDRAAHRGERPEPTSSGPLAGPHPGQDVRSARHRAPAVHRRPADVDGALSALPSSAPLHPEPVRFSTEQAGEVVAAIGDALADAELTVDELTEVVVDRTGSWAGEETMEAFGGGGRGGAADQHGRAPRHALLRAEPGPLGHLHQPAPLAAWLPPPRRRRGAAHLVMRYLYAYGPATPQHFARWLTIPPRAPSSCSRAGRRAGAGRATVRRHGSWPATPPPPPAAPGVRLLPYFDAFVVVGQPRERLYPGAADPRAHPGQPGRNYPVLLVDGVVGGVWHQRRSAPGSPSPSSRWAS